jgi:N-acetylglucosamine kinase-like BadF-type ATPase
VTGRVLLAVDGGNSKTDVALVSADGSVLAAVRGRGSSPHHLGLEGSMRLLTSLIDGACEQAGIRSPAGPVAAVGAWFMAGADLPGEERALKRAVERLGVAGWNHVMNDTFAVLHAGTDAGWGVAVVSGAGVNCVGLAPDGRTARFPALGDITGDWGGGADIGLAALAASVRAEDRRGPPTALCGRVAAHFGRRRATDVAIGLHNGHVDRAQLLELAPIVADAATAGDAAAIAILERQADEVVALVAAALRRLRLTRQEVSVVLGGSVLAALPERILDRIDTAVRLTAPHATTTVCRDRPIVGAALSALDLAMDGRPAAPASRRRLRRVLNDHRFRDLTGRR